MKKNISLALVLILAFVLNACSSSMGPAIPVDISFIKTDKAPHSMIFGRNQNQVLGSLFAENVVLDIDIHRKRIAGKYVVLDGPGYLVNDGSVNRFYALHHKKNAFAVFALSPVRLINTLQTGDISLAGGVVRPGYNEIWTSNGQNKLFIFTRDFALKKTITMGRFPQHIAFTRDGKEAIVTLKGENAIGIIDTREYREVRRIKTGIYPRDIIISGNKACVSNYASHDISIIDLAKGVENVRLKVKKAPHSMDYKKGTLWVACEKSSRIVAIDISKEKIIGHIRAGFAPGDILARDDGSLIVSAPAKKSIALLYPQDQKK